MHYYLINEIDEIGTSTKVWGRRAIRKPWEAEGREGRTLAMSTKGHLAKIGSDKTKRIQIVYIWDEFVRLHNSPHLIGMSMYIVTVRASDI